MVPPSQTHDASTDDQSDLHPSLLAVLSSSHFSVHALRPSPQCGTQTVGLRGLFWYNPEVQKVQVSLEVVDPPLQTHEDSTELQSDLHPSPLTVFPSSHFSVPASSPSPHWVTQAVGFKESFW